jgi:glycosyltransferase involved in cell wall biosynthesis
MGIGPRGQPEVSRARNPVEHSGQWAARRSNVREGKVRLLCVGRHLSGGGTARVQNTLLGSLDRSRFEVKLFYLSGGESQFSPPVGLCPEFGVQSHALLNKRAAAITRRLFRLARWSDLVFGMQDGRPVHLAVLAGRLAHRPVVSWIHNMPSRTGQDFPGGQPWATRFSYPLADRLIAVSEGVAQDARRCIPGISLKTVVLPNPIDLEEVGSLAGAPLPAWAEEAFARKTILGAGSLVRRKGFDTLLAAFASVVQQGHDANLLILGEGEERVSLESQARELGLQGRVFMPGFQRNPYPFFKRAEAFVLSSRHEGLSMVILEAMSLGTPVVSTDCPFGPRELLQDGRCGILAPPENPDGMADAIRRLLSSPELGANYRKLGPQRAKSYDAPTATRRFEALFLDVLKSR